VDLLAGRFAALINDASATGSGSGPRPSSCCAARLAGQRPELLHVVEAAMVVCDGEECCPAPARPLRTAATVRVPGPAPDAPLRTLEEVERTHIESVLRPCRATAGTRPDARDQRAQPVRKLRSNGPAGLSAQRPGYKGRRLTVG